MPASSVRALTPSPASTLSAMTAALLAIGVGCPPALGAESAVTQLPAVAVSGERDRDDVRPAIVSTATKTDLAVKDIPQTIDTIDMNRVRDYGATDLGMILEGTPGIDTSWDMRSASMPGTPRSIFAQSTYRF